MTVAVKVTLWPRAAGLSDELTLVAVDALATLSGPVLLELKAYPRRSWPRRRSRKAGLNSADADTTKGRDPLALVTRLPEANR